MIIARAAVCRTPIALHGGRLGLQQAPFTIPASRCDFSVSLNAFGPAPIVRSAIANAPIDEYPDPLNRAVRAAASAQWGCPITEVTVGAGAAELIHATCFAYLRRGDVTLIAAPAFGEYARAASLCGSEPRFVALGNCEGDTRDLSRLLEEIGQCRPRFVFLASPVSPTGEAFERDALKELANACQQTETLLVLDQAYDGLSERPIGTPAVPGHPHVLHLRSLTKDHGLAGVRVAIAVGPPDVIASLDRARVPWVVSTVAQAAAIAALTEEALLHVERTRALLRVEAHRIAERCTALGLPHSATATHFLAIRTGNGPATRDRLLADSQLLVRDCTSFGMPDWIRVAARTHEETDVLLAAVGRITARRLHNHPPEAEPA